MDWLIEVFAVVGGLLVIFELFGLGYFLDDLPERHGASSFSREHDRYFDFATLWDILEGGDTVFDRVYLDNGVLSINEIRAAHGLPPLQR
jgi:hypothetical protein